jgi:hypothetical protein
MKLVHARQESGFAMVTAIVLMALMLALGIAALGLTDAESGRTREQRVRESALQLDEGVLYAQSLVLSTKWANAGNPYPPSCTSGGATSDMCPSAGNLAGASGSNFSNIDQLNSSTWITKVRDNGGALASAYDPLKADLAQTGCPLTPCTYDFNKDNELWVQAQSTLRDGSAAKPHFKSRNVVARLRLEEVTESIPRTAVTAGAISITNNGAHGGTPIINASGSSVLVRCASTAVATCVDAKPGQIVPDPVAATVPNLMTAAQIARFKSRAIKDGRYYSGCPTKDASNKYDLSGQVVFIEGCDSPPNFTNQVKTVACSPPPGMGTECTNAANAPGLIIWHCGRADFAGGFTHRGVLYLANNTDNTCPAALGTRGDGKCVGQNVDDTRDVLTTSGGFAVWGSLAVDGNACMKVGSNGLQVVFDGNVFESVSSYGTVGLVQNTWRELPPKAVS